MIRVGPKKSKKPDETPYFWGGPHLAYFRNQSTMRYAQSISNLVHVDEVEYPLYADHPIEHMPYGVHNGVLGDRAVLVMIFPRTTNIENMKNAVVVLDSPENQADIDILRTALKTQLLERGLRVYD